MLEIWIETSIWISIWTSTSSFDDSSDDDDWETDCGSEISLSNASCRSGTIEQSVNENEYGSLVLRFETVFHYLVLHFCSLLYQPLPLRFFSGHLETRHLESR